MPACVQCVKNQYNKMPCLCAGIEWLLDKFKAYVILRDRLLSDTSILRDKLEVAAPEVANGQSNAHASTSKQCSTPKFASHATCLCSCMCLLFDTRRHPSHVYSTVTGNVAPEQDLWNCSSASA